MAGSKELVETKEQITNERIDAAYTEEKGLSLFETLNKLNVNDQTESKNGLTYLSWAWAWSKFKENCPDATFEVKEFEDSNGVMKPYLYDENLGYIVSTSVYTGEQEIPMYLPVLNNSNKAMKAVEYTQKTAKTETVIQPATMFDINTAIVRCLTKNLAMFGLGLYIYAGEDLPEGAEEDPKKKDSKKKPTNGAPF